MEQLFATLVASEPGALLKTAIRIVHLAGLFIGLGAATILDLVVIRFMLSGRISQEHATVVDFMSSVVAVGLALLWVSGIGFLLHYYAYDPAKLWNEKVWAKIAIVGVLTLNGRFIHKIVLPTIKARVGESLLAGLPVNQRNLLLTLGAVSGTSWYVPFLLGAVPQLNFVTPIWVILFAYTLFLAAAIAASQRIAEMLLPNPAIETARSGSGVLPRRAAEATAGAHGRKEYFRDHRVFVGDLARVSYRAGAF